MKLSEEHKAKLKANSQKGKSLSEEYKAKIAAGRLGKKYPRNKKEKLQNN